MAPSYADTFMPLGGKLSVPAYHFMGFIFDDAVLVCKKFYYELSIAGH